jgi:hypothetical protein
MLIGLARNIPPPPCAKRPYRSPNGERCHSPGLRGTSYPGFIVIITPTLKGLWPSAIDRPGYRSRRQVLECCVQRSFHFRLTMSGRVQTKPLDSTNKIESLLVPLLAPRAIAFQSPPTSRSARSARVLNTPQRCRTTPSTRAKHTSQGCAAGAARALFSGPNQLSKSFLAFDQITVSSRSVPW